MGEDEPGTVWVSLEELNQIIVACENRLRWLMREDNTLGGWDRARQVTRALGKLYTMRDGVAQTVWYAIGLAEFRWDTPAEPGDAESDEARDEDVCDA